ncbi:MAG: hypothetical protein A2W72_12825 [Burkholderiales bacterium RIFCSPLOWO2_12_67_14]|nr:MAG: hypothetical protein A3I64_18240 [Burkholderiales bacterium RIFCSPLOWO2_02_FULL_67_64]OGB41488.1 MAG: hypothetical protein A3E51_27040 [Burkholderiales bacterium RIFCSPHIGHO2_12_FULL_67_38]OGB50555.1 MAG: hypothetical protein A2W72_12825 [Burkholderiales bacterium RIFCSPLOWO2_12_67_14]
MEDMNMKKHFWALALATPLLLSACGGGSDAPADSSPADKYVGVWAAPCVDLGNGFSVVQDWTFTKTGATNLTIDADGTVHSGSSCSGKGTPANHVQGSMSINGQTAGADRVSFHLGASQFKELWLVQGAEIHMRSTGAKDAEGYPNTVGSDTVFRRK